VAELLRSSRPDGRIIKLSLRRPASHTDIPMLTSVVPAQWGVIAVFGGADREKVQFCLWKNL
jgi:hypothetical protein